MKEASHPAAWPQMWEVWPQAGLWVATPPPPPMLRAGPPGAAQAIQSDKHAPCLPLPSQSFLLLSSLSFPFLLLQNMSPYHYKSSLSFSLNAKSMNSGGGTKFLNILFIYILHLVNQQIATLMLLSCKVPCLLRSQQQVLVHSSPGNVCSAGACDHWPVCRVPGRRCLCCQCPHCPVVPDTVRGVDRRKYLLGTMVGIILRVPSWQPASHQPEIEQKLIWPLSNHRHCHLTNCQQRVILSFLFVEGHFWCSELWESDYLRM